MPVLFGFCKKNDCEEPRKEHLNAYWMRLANFCRKHVAVPACPPWQEAEML